MFTISPKTCNVMFNVIYLGMYVLVEKITLLMTVPPIIHNEHYYFSEINLFSSL